MPKTSGGGGKTLSYLLAGLLAFVTSSAWAASFWKGTGPESGKAANWDNGKAFMGNDYFYFRDAKMTTADYRRYMRLTADANNTNGQGMLFQCGTEDDPFVIEDDGGNRVITLKYSSSSNVGGIYIGHSKNTDNSCYYGGVELRGGIWTCDQIYVGGGANYCGYLRLNGASLTTKGSSSNPCENGKIVVDAGTLTFAKGLSLGKDGGTAELVVNGGTMSCGGDLLLGSASGDNGSLTVNGGTLTVSSGWTKGYSNKATVNLNGGTLCTYHIHEQAGSTTVNFNGGTLRAETAYTSNGGLIHGNVSVTVGANGGAIDNGGFDVSISAALGGTGGLVFTGGGTTTLNKNVNYAGATAVTPGTTLAIAHSDAKTNILRTHGLVVAGIPTPGQTIVTCNSALTADDCAKVSCPLAPATTFEIGEDGMSIVVAQVGSVLDNYWTGAEDNDLGKAVNWSKNEVPTGNANIFSAVPATLTKGGSFAPTAITFLEGSATVTIDGEDFKKIVAVTNLSSVSHTINAKVFFDGDIQVKQAAMAETGDLTKAHVTFAGGAYAADGHALESGDFSAVYSRCVFGKYYLNNAVDNRWTAQYQSGGKRVCVADGSYLYVPYAGNTKELYVGNDAKVVVADMETSIRPSYRVCGEMVITNMTMTGTGNRYLSYNQGTATPGVYKFYSIVNEMSSNWWYIHDEYAASKHEIYIGKGGLNYSGEKGVYHFGVNKTGNLEVIRPWNSDFTIADRGNTGGALMFLGEVEFNTDDEGGTGRTIMVNAMTRLYKNTSAAITVSGKGTLQVNNNHVNDSGTSLTMNVKDTATLAFGEGASLGTGTITLGDGTKLVLTADSSSFSIPNTLNLPTGENKVTKIRIDGKRLRSGDNIIATVGNNATTANVELDGDSSALDGRKATLRVEGGILILNVASDGLMIIVR